MAVARSRRLRRPCLSAHVARMQSRTHVRHVAPARMPQLLSDARRARASRAHACAQAAGAHGCRRATRARCEPL
eukprot:509345-Pleurochrysis_carterae.AAC.1